MTTAKFVISLDFELFWGVADTQTVAGYGRNVFGVWQAIPRLLALFARHRIRVTWATVGMLMCRNYEHWRGIRPAMLPTYARRGISPYDMDDLVKQNERLFFGRPLVQQIVATEGQELATHTYSHFYCNEAGATPAQFAADLACAKAVASELGVQFHSVVLPRNQISESFLPVLTDAGITVFRGNADHWLYRDGDRVPGGVAGRLARFSDACLPLSGSRTVHAARRGALVNVPASLFLYPWSPSKRAVSAARLRRLQCGMTAAARSGGVFHLWWHPHNHGVNLEQNLSLLDELLRHYRVLADTYGMQSQCLADFSGAASTASDSTSDALPEQPATDIHLLRRSSR